MPFSDSVTPKSGPAAAAPPIDAGFPDWLSVSPGDAPLVLSLPHTGTDIPADIEASLASPALARLDTDWWIERLYDFAGDLGATVIRTRMSRSVVDVNRDPSGASLYPGQATTELCPTTTFDGDPLYREGRQPDTSEIAGRRARWFEPYHAAISSEVARLHARHGAVVLYDCHSIRSVVPRLFEGVLPNFNIGTNSGAACAPALTQGIVAVCSAAPFTHVVDGRFKGGWITRHHGRPERNVHAVQMELACRTYLPEPDGRAAADNWPAPYDAGRAEPARAVLHRILQSCLDFARSAT